MCSLILRITCPTMEVWPGHQLTVDSNSPFPCCIQIHVDKIIHPTNKTAMLCHFGIVTPTLKPFTHKVQIYVPLRLL